MGLEQDNLLILMKKTVILVELFFLGKKAVLAITRVSRASMMVKLGPERHYFGDSGANLNAQSPQGLANFVFVHTRMLVSPANKSFELAMSMKSMQTFTVEVIF